MQITVFVTHMWIESQGFTVETMRECQFNRLIKEDANLKAFVEDNHMSTPLTPANAFFGGRVNALRLYHDCADDEEIKVVDFTSLYPWVSDWLIIGWFID